MAAPQLIFSCFVIHMWLSPTEGNNWLRSTDMIHSFLEGPLVWTAKVMNKFQCENLCAKLKLCSSANYDLETRLCQTVGSSAKSPQHTEGIIRLKEPRQFPRDNPCASHPCPETSVCATVTPPFGRSCLGIVLEADCSAPDPLENGNFTFTDTKYKSVLIYNCDVGYNFSGDNNIAMCGTLGQWKGFSGKCEIIDCEDPVPLLNGRPSYTLTTYGENVTFSCDIGYNFSGSDNVATCGSSGLWEGFNGQCEQITCTAPDALDNANHFFNNSTYGAEVIYNCSTGYNFTGDSNVATCSTSGRWEGLDGQCNLIDCGPPTILNNSTTASTSTTYGSVADYTCNIGYNFSGSSDRASCNADGFWGGLMGLCQIVDCGVPGEVAHGNVVYDGTTYASVAVYTCNVGYNYSGIVEGATCDHNGLWQGRGMCQIVDCGTPPDVVNANSTYTTTTFTANVTYECRTDYVFTGTTLTSSCTETGIWIGMNGLCVEYFVNIAANKTATQFSTYGSSTADRALSGHCADGNHVNQPWWKVDFGRDFVIDHMRASLRSDCCSSRMSTLTHVLESANGMSSTTCPKTSGSITAGSVLRYNCVGTGSFRYLTFRLTVYSAMTLCDVRVYIINPLL
ncbi:sushi, von Willebrand factor type A, EGF and pentraxin domain-containing protein 1-like isoform X1 [Haliotis rufescens]|uniref:sushi, von Willebrand factor type A, EGF and pentraxin domain-containing protein 1-like isoform X1 n=1 Tax=Haliotis rufescens TaxID=6454 RepID=UPI00201EC5E0|nr:sushi, von Willebrand factor type A, EGF and pentraxin domain-containing protein 1-like isoform X1 [Haliotis rufescens]